MEHSLGALLPVRNAEATLEWTVLEMLEVLPDLTSRFELVIVDDGSSDATIEVADELAGSYPQVTAVRHAQAQGRWAAIRTGLSHTHADVIFLADADCDLSLGEVRKLWDQLSEHELVFGRPAPALQPARPSGNTPALCLERGYQIGYRRAFVSLAHAVDDQAALLDHLRRHGLKWHEVEIGRRGPHRERADRRQSGQSRPKRPNYLTRLRDFALGQ